MKLAGYLHRPMRYLRDYIDFYSQFLSLASSRTDLYAFNNPCSERSTFTLVISVGGGFETLEQIFAASVSKIILPKLAFAVFINIPIVTNFIDT
jgi:hypothetical protein